MSPSLAQRLTGWWYARPLAPALWVLLPLSWLFRLLVASRRWLYQRRVLDSQRLPVPVIVVGNLTVGGSGKTPFTLWLVQRLRERGRQPGIISRGYGGEGAAMPVEVGAAAEARVVGDEPLLLARRSGVPVFVCRDRVAAGRALLAAHPECDLLVADDGLQHYRLERDAEVLVFDGRGVGNGHLLPAGPLREPRARALAATAIVWNGGASCRLPDAAGRPPEFAMRLVGERFIALDDAGRTCTADDLRGRRLYAVAGIGDPGRFFRQLEGLGLSFVACPFADHYVFSAGDFSFAQDGVLLMTEKDGVKCSGFVSGEAWVLPVDARIDDLPDGRSLPDTLLEKLNGRSPA